MRLPSFVGSRWRSQDGESLNSTARHVLVMVLVGTFGLAAVVWGVQLVGGFHQSKELLAGALLAWGSAAATWGVGQLRERPDRLGDRIRHNAVVTVLNHRLNEIGAKLGVPDVDNDEIHQRLAHMESMEAHWSGLDELRPK